MFGTVRSSICNDAASGHIALRKENHGCNIRLGWG
jgi:hypothetical protein